MSDDDYRAAVTNDQRDQPGYESESIARGEASGPTTHICGWCERGITDHCDCDDARHARGLPAIGEVNVPDDERHGAP